MVIKVSKFTTSPLQQRHIGHHCVSNHRQLECLFNSVFRLSLNIRITGPFIRGIRRWSVDSPHKGPVKCRKRFHDITFFMTDIQLVNSSAVVKTLTHWGRVTHICVSIIGSDNGLWPGRRRAIIWTNAGILLIWPLGTHFSEISIDIQTFSFKKIHLKMSGKWRPFCLGLNVLTVDGYWPSQSNILPRGQPSSINPLRFFKVK